MNKVSVYKYVYQRRGTVVSVVYIAAHTVAQAARFLGVTVDDFEENADHYFDYANLPEDTLGVISKMYLDETKHKNFSLEDSPEDKNKNITIFIAYGEDSVLYGVYLSRPNLNVAKRKLRVVTGKTEDAEISIQRRVVSPSRYRGMYENEGAVCLCNQADVWVSL